MTDCIIHIGMHKTGSTSIQSSLSGFSDEHFLYADFSEANHSLAIYSLFAANPENHHIHRVVGRNAAAMRNYISTMQANLERAIDQAKGRTLIISGEDIGSLPKDALERLRKYFNKHFDNLSIVGYVRSPAGFITSGFQQRVKLGAVKHRINLDVEYRQYEKNFGKFDEVFGRENVHYWKFDPKTFPGGCVVQDFCSRLGISFPAERIVRLNESLYRQSVSLLYIYYNYGQKHGADTMKGPEAQILGDTLAAVGEDKFRFSPDVLRPVLEKNRADIGWMERRLGQSLSEELGEPRPGDIRSEADLLNLEPEVIDKLLMLAGDRAARGVTGKTLEEVALLVHSLRGERDPKCRVTVPELLAQMQQKNPQLLNGISNDKAAMLIRNLFKHMSDTLATTDKTVIQYPGLGQFQVNKVVKEEDGKKSSNTRISFRLAEIKKDEQAGDEPVKKNSAATGHKKKLPENNPA